MLKKLLFDHAVVVSLAIAAYYPGSPLAAELSMPEAVDLALAEEPGLARLSAEQDAEWAAATADAQLPDPVITLGALNLPVDTFELDQEAMTQLKVGVRQDIPRGNTRDIRRRQRETRARQFNSLHHAREIRIVRDVRLAWLGVYREHKVLALMAQAKPLFEELIDVTESLYALGGSSQQDVIRASLERDRLDDRIYSTTDQLSRARANLARWIAGAAERRPADRLPALTPPTMDDAAWHEALVNHPAITAMDGAVRRSELDVRLAEEAFKPRWSVDVGYGFRRGEDTMGDDRPDFFSAAVSFDLPLMTGKRQDPRLRAATHRHEASHAGRLDSLYELKAELVEAQGRFDALTDRTRLFRAHILPASEQAAAAALVGYRADTSDFAEVMRAAIAQLDSDIELVRINVELAGVVAQLRYLAGQGDPS